MSTRRYGPGRPGLLPILQRPSSPINLRKYAFDAYDQADRAARAIDRFRGFHNGFATGDVIKVLLDEMLEAAEAVWHLKDHINHELKELKQHPDYENKAQAGTEKVKVVEKSEMMQVLRVLANASKHGRITRTHAFKDTLTLEFPDSSLDQSYPPHLSDVYRGLRMVIGSNAIVHPTDFLEARLREWNDVISRHLAINVGRRIVEKLGKPGAQDAENELPGPEAEP